MVEADGPSAAEVQELISIAGHQPVTIADGHHRYETALRYRDERRMSRSCEEDPPFDYLLMLFLETTAERLTVLPTHRIVRSIGDEGVATLRARLPELFNVRPAEETELVDAFGGAEASGGAGRFGLWSRDGGAFLEARSEAVQDQEFVFLDRIAYTKSAADAIAAVDERWADADAAFLVEPTPVRSIMEVAREGDVMPQKSTYFYPKALTGLVINPHEW